MFCKSSMKTSRPFQIMNYEDSQLSTLIQEHRGSREGQKQVVHVREIKRFGLNIILYYSTMCVICVSSDLVIVGWFLVCVSKYAFSLFLFSDSENSQMPSVYLVLKFKCLERNCRTEIS